MQIKKALRFHLATVRMAIINNQPATNADEVAEEKEPTSTVGKNVN
jgi:hypothetical protein